MNREIYISENGLMLAEYLPSDCQADWLDWQDDETREGYNFIMDMPLSQYQNRTIRNRLYAVILRADSPDTPVGIVMISPPHGDPDLAIRVFAPYRGNGLGTAAFHLAAEYALAHMNIETLHAGCYEGNMRSQRMLLRCGFVRNPAGDQQEAHYVTGNPIMQYDYVFQGAI